MKKTFRAVLLLALAALLFVSCENKASQPSGVKALLSGNSIVSTVNCVLGESEKNMFLNISFDDQGGISFNDEGYSVSGFVGEVKGDEYKTSFKLEIDAKAAKKLNGKEEAITYDFELTFKLVENESVSVTGTAATGSGEDKLEYKLNGLVEIFHAPPQWVTAYDYVYFREFHEHRTITSFANLEFSTYYNSTGLYDTERYLSSKVSADSFSYTDLFCETEEGTTYYFEITTIIEMDSKGNIELINKISLKDYLGSGAYKESLDYMPSQGLMLIPPLPEWISRINSLDDVEKSVIIPLAASAVLKEYKTMDMYKRTVEEDVLSFSVEYVETDGETTVRFKDIYTVYKPNADGKFAYTIKHYKDETEVGSINGTAVPAI